MRKSKGIGPSIMYLLLKILLKVLDNLHKLQKKKTKNTTPEPQSIRKPFH